MQNGQSVALGRITRLAQSRCLLGEPDIISIKQIKFSSSLFNKDKRAEDTQENYINGLIFPTTAHFSSFISSRYKAKDPSKLSIKARLFMFDAYGQKDIQIQISIPGSMEVKAINLRGQAVAFSAFDYERAYYSSFLRSLYPMNYPGIILYPLLNRIEILKPIIKNFMPFSFKNELRELEYEFEVFRRQEFEQEERMHNLSLQILMNYCLQNGFFNLLKIILDELRRQKSQKVYQLQLECKLKQKKYAEVIYKTAEKLVMHTSINQLKQYQIRALHQLGKHSEIVFLGRTLIQSGGISEQAAKIVLRSLVDLGEDQKFLKTLNLLLNLHNNEERRLRQVSHRHNNPNTFSLEQYVTKVKCISEHPQLCFPFDNTFLNRLAQYQSQKEMLLKNSKEGLTVGLLQKVEESLHVHPIYYESLVYYVKQRGWANLVRYRAECFWLQSDFVYQAQSLKSVNPQPSFDDKFSFFQKKFQLEEVEMEMPEQQPRQQSQPQPEEQVQQSNQQAEQFQGNLSEHECPREMHDPPKCSARIFTIRKLNTSDRKAQSKIQCSVVLQQMFFSLFNDLKLHNSLQNWQQKLKETDNQSFSKTKRQIAAVIFIKKGFLSRKLQQNKKCEQAFRNARKLSDSLAINLVAIYQLILLYIENKNAKGVEFYLIELVKIFKNMGIDTFDIVPEWTKPVLQFVVHCEGLSIVKNIHPLFKNVVGYYLRSNHTEEEVDIYTNSKN